jgi:protein-S-isoprenylcysteine O-methyltransferase Ste14
MNLSLYLSCRINRNEPWLDVFFKMLGSNYFTLFILHRVNMEVIFSRNNPDYDFSPWYWVNWSLGMVMFVLFAGSYLTRSNPIARANRLREIIYPLFVDREWLTILFQPFANAGPRHWSTISIALILLGHSISVWALVYLRRSFGILTEVRNLVTKGPYRFVRHPLYVGENFAAIGFCFMFPSWFNIAITILFLLSQRLRAHFEEQKFRSTLPDYERYMKRVGAYLPRLNKTQKS